MTRRRSPFSNVAVNLLRTSFLGFEAKSGVVLHFDLAHHLVAFSKAVCIQQKIPEFPTELEASIHPGPVASIQHNENLYPIRKLPSFLSKKTNVSSTPDRNLS